MQLVLIIVGSVAAAIVLSLAALALIIVKLPFSKRCDKNPLLKYFTAADFGLAAKAVEVPYVNKKKKRLSLRGYIYKKESVEPSGKLVIFCHGMGPGQIAYTTEIAYFCNLGHTVFAVDYAGCNFSDGKNIRGFYSGVEAAEAAVDYADEKLEADEIYLVGHSWGGYSALCAARTRQVEGIVAISAPDRPSKVLLHGAGSVMPKFLVALAYPFIALFMNGRNASAAEGARYANTPVLLIHGDKDNVVNRENAAYFKAFGDNIEKYAAESKAHNPYNTVEAEKKLSELSAKLAEARKSGRADRAFFNAFDFKAATEEDSIVMAKIADFISQNPTQKS